MISNSHRKVEFVANVMIIAVALSLLVVLVRSHLIPRSGNDPTNKPYSATTPDLSALGIDWHENQQTLILAISTECHFCTESAGFYKELARKRPAIRLVAVLPQSIDNGRTYLERVGVTVDDVKQVSLPALNISGTPTLILVNGEGQTIRTWTGKLSPEGEAEVSRTIRKFN